MAKNTAIAALHRNPTLRLRLALLALCVGACDTVTPTPDANAGLSDVAGTDIVAPIDAPDVVGTDGVVADGLLLDSTTEVDCPGGIGCTCASNGDCNTGFCVETSEGLRCSSLCTTTCGEGFVCRSMGGAEPISYCAPLGLRDCAPCSANADCNGAGAMPAACVSAGAAGSFCATTCTVNSDCPLGASCSAVGGQSGKFCQPEGGLAQCSCSAWATTAKATTLCEIADGTQVCPGSRFCGPTGLTDCAYVAGETCYDAGCKDAPDGSICDDGDPCTADSTCNQGKCGGGISVCECLTSADCKGTEDGNLCNGTLYCDSASKTCKINPATVVQCPAPSGPCDAVTCSPATGSCTYQSLPDNSACDDGKACTAGDYCNAGKCVSGTVTCVCNTDADCTGLEDGNACNGTLFCNKVKGQCQLNPKTAIYCPTGQDTSCLKNLCDKSTGACAMTAVADSLACSDGNPCTAGEACQAGQCTSTANTCSCTSNDDCLKAEDGNLCNGTLFCDLAVGTCKVNPATVVQCHESDNPCSPNVCTPATGQCAPAPLPTGSPCDDGNFCSASEACAGGVCQPGANLCSCLLDSDCAAYEDGNSCNGTLYCDKQANTCAINPASIVQCPTVNDTACERNLCAPASGTCAMTLLADGEPCDDGVPCTANTVCTSNQCGGGVSVCACASDADCATWDDGDLCNGLYYCDKSVASGACKPNPASAVSCPASLPGACTESVCEPSTGDCIAVVLADGATCDDDNGCTTLDSCAIGLCAGVTEGVCDDGLTCTVDACDPLKGCSHTSSEEVCDGADNDCDGETDEEDTLGCIQWYEDQDGDTFGNPAKPKGCWCTAGQAGSSVSDKAGDCSDINDQINNGASEACDGLDNDCDGTKDELGATGCTPWFEDMDSDGYGAKDLGCWCDPTKPGGSVSKVGGDCNDTNAALRPTVPEVCDGMDNNCDGMTDDGEATQGCKNYWEDADGDGWGTYFKPAAGCACKAPAGMSSQQGDCNDANTTVNASMQELCGDGEDNDCDGQKDESQCVCSNAAYQEPGCTACAWGYTEVAPGQCGSSQAIWGAISGSGWGATCTYADVGHWIAVDERTGLYWLNPDIVALGDAPNLLAACSQSMVGYDDWRPPTAAELITALQTEAGSIGLATCILPAPGTNMQLMTASVLDPTPPGVQYALDTYGSGALIAKSVPADAGGTLANIACVRGGNNVAAPVSRFVPDLATDTMLDTLTGLTWQLIASPNVLSTDAATYCDTVTSDGGGWRLPTAVEAATLIDFDSTGMEFAGDQLLGFGVGDLSEGTHLLWTATTNDLGARVVFGPTTLMLDDMTDTYGGNQILCVKGP